MIKLFDKSEAHGFVHYELIDDETGKIVAHGDGKLEKRWIQYLPWWLIKYLTFGKQNAILDEARTSLANFMLGVSETAPEFCGIATGTGEVASSDTTLDTPVDYDGANDAKIANTKILRGNFIARYIFQFDTDEANQNIRQLGLFDAANAGDLWAKVKVVIDKDSTQRLNVYWYIIFERRSGLAIKTGGSIGATGTATQDTISTLTFATPVTVVRVNNRTGSVVFIKINEALDTNTNPKNYDYKLADGDDFELLEEQISISTLSVTSPAANFTMPSTVFTARGW